MTQQPCPGGGCFTRRRVLPLVTAVLVITTGAKMPPVAAAGAANLLRLTVDGEVIEGRPLAIDGQRVHLLARDGRLWDLSLGQVTSIEKTSKRFRPYSLSQLRATLLRELGKEYEVSGTSRFVVAHPAGQRTDWADRFEQVYRDFYRYFHVRRFKLHEPRFPLIGIVCKDYSDFVAFSARSGAPPARGVVGYYSLRSNRIVVFDMSAGDDSRDTARQASYDTVVHEATHQVSYNTGLLSRYVANPLWVVEGTAMLFEAQGIRRRDARDSKSSRINQGRLRDFDRVFGAGAPTQLETLVASDRPFRRNPMAAYAQSWAFTFYLVETQPTKFAEYLRRISDREPFEAYTAAERTADFTAVFGDNWPLLEARFLRYMKKLK